MTLTNQNGRCEHLGDDGQPCGEGAIATMEVRSGEVRVAVDVCEEHILAPVTEFAAGRKAFAHVDETRPTGNPVCCGALNGALTFACTRAVGHPGDHVACGEKNGKPVVCGRWAPVAGEEHLDDDRLAEAGLLEESAGG
jgi:hypothetical protein